MISGRRTSRRGIYRRLVRGGKLDLKLSPDSAFDSKRKQIKRFFVCICPVVSAAFGCQHSSTEMSVNQGGRPRRLPGVYPARAATGARRCGGNRPTARRGESAKRGFTDTIFAYSVHITELLRNIKPTFLPACPSLPDTVVFVVKGRRGWV